MVSRRVGLIVRDSHGFLIGAMAIRTPNLLSVLTTKLYALKVGLSFALDASLLPVVVESDYLAAVQLLSKEEKCLAHEGVLVTKIRHLFLALSFCVRFIPHTTNTVAHRIARYSLREEELCYWLGNSKKAIASYQLNHSVAPAKHEPNAT
ncbi:hypothetical protein PRUPE_8G101300 [Prunus persica]|uniref:RNase H type-1 domain-containing protein n=1 Tax=Prunus persica TaxID=3760 RepID=A0A251MVX7_PRUPE|nr:hypothetical protein PRUPE_8G101300 [Prunus persica]